MHQINKCMDYFVFWLADSKYPLDFSCMVKKLLAEEKKKSKPNQNTRLHITNPT